MKKVAFAIILFFAFIATSDTSLAKTDTGYETALQYYYAGKYEEAIRLLKDYVEKKPDSSAYYYMGYALYKIGKYDEANKYFKMAYLIDPMSSADKMIFEKYPEIKEIKKPARKKVTPKQIPQVAQKPVVLPKETQPPKEIKPQEIQKPLVAPKVTPKVIQPPTETKPQEIQKPEVTPTKKPALPAPQEFKPQEKLQPPITPPPFPGPMKDIQVPPPIVKPKGIDVLSIIIVIVEIALYLYFCLCFYLIAKKLNVPAPWIAFIPIVQIWTIVASAGKPWWWILLLLVPIVNIVVGIYLWLCITENLGRNKWLGLLMLVPIVNFVYLGILAFSKKEEFRYVEEAPAE